MSGRRLRIQLRGQRRPCTGFPRPPRKSGLAPHAARAG